MGQRGHRPTGRASGLQHLAVRAAGTLTSYRLLLGHCLLAVQRRDIQARIGAEARQDLAAEQVRDEALLAKCPARDNSEWLATVAAREEECPGNGELQLVMREKPHWKNPQARVPSPARRRELLRRKGYWCSTPGCPNHLYLETHPIVFCREKGQTVPDNLVVLCSSTPPWPDRPQT